MSNKENPRRIKLNTVEGRKPRLSKAGCKDHESSLVTLGAGPLKGFQGLPLDPVGRRWGFGFLRKDLGRHHIGELRSRFL